MLQCLEERDFPVSELVPLASARSAGKTVTFRGEEVVIGALSSLSKTSGDFYITYRFSIQQIHWEDMIDETNG